MSSLNQFNKFAPLALVAMTVLLSACETRQDDLARYISDVKARPSTPIPPIPAGPNLYTLCL